MMSKSGRARGRSFQPDRMVSVKCRHYSKWGGRYCPLETGKRHHGCSTEWRKETVPTEEAGKPSKDKTIYTGPSRSYWVLADSWVDKWIHNVVHTYREIVFSLKKEILIHATWTNLENIMLSEETKENELTTVQNLWDTVNESWEGSS